MASVERGDWLEGDPPESASRAAVPEGSVAEQGIVIDLRGETPVLRLPDVVSREATELIRSAIGGWQAAAKRALDVVGGLLGLILLAPLFLAVATAIRLTSRGPAFYVQDRVGRAGRTFRMVKFRSMYRDAEETRHVLEPHNEVDGPAFKMQRDPRITPIGRVLRRLSIDELPQLVNVVRGEMSLVGPRPPLPDEVARWSERERGRLLVKPGLTCIWQVSGRSDLDYATWVEMDLRYVREWSLSLDLKLLVRTLPAVVLGRGAY